jgi:hypothetical protein
VPKRLLILCVAITVCLAIAGCQASGTNKSEDTVASGSAPKTEAKAKPSIDEIRAVLQAHDKALNDKISTP